MRGMISPLESAWSLSSGGIKARISEPIPRQVGMQVEYSLCSQVSEESSLWPNPAEDWKNLSSALSAKGSRVD